MKSKSRDCYAKGGKVKKMIDGEKDHEEEKEAEGKKLATGGGVLHKKVSKARSVVKAHGHKSMPRSDKKARGGKVATPKSPLTGAMPQGLPGGGKGQSVPDKSND